MKQIAHKLRFVIIRPFGGYSFWRQVDSAHA